jgi:carboxyl-terminal processing protease
MTTSRLFTLMAVTVLAGSAFLAVTYSQELAPTATKEDVELFEKLDELYRVIEENFYAEPSVKDLFSGAVNGMLHELDPHSGFVDAEDYPRIEEQYRGNYSGIGVSFVMLDDKITVVDVVKGGPSDKAGLQMGDFIVEIEGESAVGLTSDEVQEKLRGPSGTDVAVGLERAAHADLVHTTITRGYIPIESVQNAMMLDDKTGYVQITRFARPTSVELERALQSLEGAGMEQLILDLRGNGGGLLGTAIELTDKFLTGERLIVYTDGQTEGAYQSFRSYKNGRNWNMPLIILINHSSASASEIVAGALQDWDRALIVGETSFGKGLVQSSYVLDDRSRLLLTTSHYFTPTGRLIQRPYKGIDLETYQMMGLDGVDSGAWEAESEVNADKPVYMTPSGRTVYGGGGITPDVEVKSDQMFDRFVYSMANQFIFFFYGREYAMTHPIDGMSFEEYFAKFKVDEKMLRGLLAKAQEREFVYYPERGRIFTDEQVEETFWQLKDQLALYLKSELAQFYFERPKGYTIRVLTRDNVLAQARKSFEAARMLAEEQTGIDPDHFAAQREVNRGTR